MKLIDRDYVKTLVGPRAESVHKGNCGKVLIIGGTSGMPGSVALAAKSAFRSGAGLVYVATKQSLFSPIQSWIPEAILIGVEQIVNRMNEFDCIAIGPGMGADLNTAMILENVLKEYDKKVIIDADGLNTIAKTRTLHKVIYSTRAKLIMTPHLGEAARLLQRPKASYEDRIMMCHQITDKYGCVLALKSHKTLVSDEKGNIMENTTGNAAMATAGSGDVLTGAMTALGANENLSTFETAAAAVYLHGLAGEVAAKTIGQYGTMARDIADSMAVAIKELVGV